MRKPALALAAWMLAAVAGAALGQEARTCRAERAAAPPKLDGALDAPCWKDASWQTDFTLLNDGRRVAEQTEFAMLWDDKFLYIGARMREPAMDAVRADAADGEDHIEIYLLSEEGGRTLTLGVNPGGARAEPGPNGAANAAELQWQCAAKRLAESWQVEIAVPLAMLRLQPREGAVVSGNVARVRFAGGGKINSTWTPLQGTFAAPDLFGKVTLTIPGKPTPMPARLDIVSLQNGDRFVGMVLGTADHKWLRFQGSQFEAPIGIDLAQVTRIESKNVNPPAAKGSRVALANGDYAIGDLKDLNAEKAILVSSAGDPMTFPAAMLATVTMGKTKSDFIDSTFDTGDLSPWTALRGKCDVSDGKAQLIRTSGGLSLLAAPFQQNGPVTFVADIEAPDLNQPTNCQMIVFGAGLSNPGPAAGVILNWTGPGYQITVVQPEGRRQMVAFKQGNEMLPCARLRLAYDPAAGEGRLWVNDAGPGESFKVPNGPKTGTHVAIGAYRSLAVKRLIAQSGIISPGDERETAPAEGVRVSLANGDTVAAQSAQLSKGRVTIKTAFGVLTPEPGAVSEIRFPRKAKAPPPVKFVRVQAADCRLAFDSCEVFEDRLVGHSAQYGDVTIRRDSVLWVQFEQGPK